MLKDFFKNKYVLNILGASAIIVVLMVGFMYWLDSYTRHDETYPTPELKGMDATLAVQTLEAMGFKWEIIDSSRYESGKRPRAVLSQDPSAGTAVKQGRKVYLKINRSSWENAPIPPVDFENDRQCFPAANCFRFYRGRSDLPAAHWPRRGTGVVRRRAFRTSGTETAQIDRYRHYCRRGGSGSRRRGYAGRRRFLTADQP